MPMYNVHENIF